MTMTLEEVLLGVTEKRSTESLCERSRGLENVLCSATHLDFWTYEGWYYWRCFVNTINAGFVVSGPGRAQLRSHREMKSAALY